MAGDTGTYYPDAGYKATGTAWGVTLGQTGTLAQWQAMTALTSTEKNNLAADDYSSGVSVQPTSGTSGSGILARMTIDDGTVSRFDFTVKGHDYGGSTYKLWAWNFSTESFDLVATHNGSSPGTFTLTGSITTDADDYLDGSGYLWAVVEDCSYDAQSHSIYFIEVVDTYTEAAAPIDVSPGSQAQCAGTASGSQTHVAGAASGSQAQAAGPLLVSQTHVASAVAPSPQAQVAEAVSGSVASAVGSPAAGYQGQSCGPVSVRQTHVAGAVAAGQEQITGQAEGLAWPAFGSPAPGSQAQSHGVPTGSQTHAASPVHAGQGQSHGTPTVSQTHVARAAAAGQAQTAGVPQGTVAPFVATPQAPGPQAQTAGAVTVSQTHVAGAQPPAAQAQDAGPAGGAYQISLLLSLTTSQARRLAWTAAGTVYVVIDGKQVGESDIGFLDLPADQAVRGVLLAYKTLPDPLPTPRDQVLLTVSGPSVGSGNVGALHHIQRRPSGGAWTEIAAILGDSYVDGPLPDGTYDYQATDEDDAAGESDPSATRTVSISSVPDPPSGLRYSWDAPAKTLTLTWQASSSADVAAYRMREGLEPLDLDGAPVQESGALSYQRVFTNETGTFVWSVRAVDADGNEERNVTQTLALAFHDGALVVRPAEPRMVQVHPAGGGALTVEFLYDPRYEDPAPAWGAVAGEGGAAEARIYWDGGTGTVDLGTPVGTVSLDGPVAPARYAWTSGRLAASTTYLWVVRISAASGIETQNTRAVSARAPVVVGVPATPDISAAVV